MNTTNALRSAGRAAHGYADRIADRAEAALATAQELTREGGDAVRDHSYRLREQALHAAAAGGQLVRQHPLRSAAIAVAAIGLTLAIVSLLGSRRDR